MWLINTTTNCLENRRNIEDEPYAILSHRWQDGEVTYRDIIRRDGMMNLYGWPKLEAFCLLALGKGYKYAWADTCCINKDSMTELSEAINSMYQWYSEAASCIVFLHDVGSGAKLFEQAEWFRRGWTLQELIAAETVEFYDKDWKYLGNKVGLVEELSRFTGIPESVLLDAKKVKECSVAQRMSWAADRETERPEDRAWSLLGLFGIRTLTPSYGAREGAFLALQEEIIRRHADQSIFAWIMDSAKKYSGPFAESPSAFKDCGNIACSPCSEPFQSDNLGISINLATRPFSMNTYLCILKACRNGAWCAILLTKIQGTELYARSQSSVNQSLLDVEDCGGYEHRLLRIKMDVPTEVPVTHYGFWLRTLKPPMLEPSTIATMSSDGRDNQDRITLPEGQYGTAGIVQIQHTGRVSGSRWSKINWIKLGFTNTFEPICLVANYSDSGSQRRLIFDEALVSDADPRLRTKLLDRSWIQGRGGVVPQIETAWPIGYYRHNFTEEGSDVLLSALNTVISVKLVPDCGMRTSIDLPEHPDRKIWVVDISDTDGTSPEKQHYCNEVEYVCRYIVGYIFAILMCPCMLNQVVAERRFTHG